MKFQTVALRHPKVDCPHLDQCEDALAYDESRGLFAVSDGVGSTIFANLWSQCLVDQYLDEPLSDNDGFEVEYWVQRARGRFRPPPAQTLPYFSQEAFRQGSAATLAALQFHPAKAVPRAAAAEEPAQPAAKYTAMAAGDSCVLHYREGRLLKTLPRSSAGEFSKLPICLPTQGYQAQWWRSVTRHDGDVFPGDVLILATDAVAAWLLADEEKLRPERFKMLVCQTRESWPEFVGVLRRAFLIQDDDSTALVVHVQDVAGCLGEANRQAAVVKAAREDRFVEACQKRDPMSMALEWGNGALLEDTDSGLDLDVRVNLQTARRIVDGRRLLLEALGRACKQQSLGNRELQALWDDYRDVLHDSPLVDKMRATLQARGVVLEPPLPAASSRNDATDASPPGVSPPGDAGVVSRVLAIIEDSCAFLGKMWPKLTEQLLVKPEMHRESPFLSSYTTLSSCTVENACISATPSAAATLPAGEPSTVEHAATDDALAASSGILIPPGEEPGREILILPILPEQRAAVVAVVDSATEPEGRATPDTMPRLEIAAVPPEPERLPADVAAPPECLAVGQQPRETADDHNVATGSPPEEPSGCDHPRAPPSDAGDSDRLA